MVAYFIQGLLLGFTAAASPGPLQVYFLSQTMQAGWRRTLPSALAPLVSDGPIILVTLLILTQTPDWFLRIIRVGGGVFLLYLALSTLIKFRRESDNESTSKQTHHTSFLKAALTNILNPNPYIFWGVIAGPILLSAWEQSAESGASFLLGFYGMLVGGFLLLIAMFATGKRFAPQLISPFIILAAFILGAFGIVQLYSGIKG